MNATAEILTIPLSGYWEWKLSTGVVDGELSRPLESL